MTITSTGLSHETRSGSRSRQAHPTPTEKLGWRLNQWCKATGVSRSKTYLLLTEGRIAAVKVDRLTIITTPPAAFLKAHAPYPTRPAPVEGLPIGEVSPEGYYGSTVEGGEVPPEVYYGSSGEPDYSEGDENVAGS
jgi:hypothetical protein